MGHPNGIHRGGVDPRKIALRDALRVYVWQHLTRYRDQWFTAVELARVIGEQYIGGPKPPSHGSFHYGRSNVLLSVLEELEGRGEVERREVPRTRASASLIRQWRWAR